MDVTTYNTNISIAISGYILTHSHLEFLWKVSSATLILLKISFE